MRRTLLAGALVVTLVACAPVYDGTAILGPLDTSDPQIALGERVFALQCQQCHPNASAGLGPGITNKPLPSWAVRLQAGRPQLTNTYYNLSSGASARGPWNEGESPDLGETWQYFEDPIQHVIETEGLTTTEPSGTDRTRDEVMKRDRKLGKERADAVRKAVPEGPNQWSAYPQEQPKSPTAPKAPKATKVSKSKET